MITLTMELNLGSTYRYRVDHLSTRLGAADMRQQPAVVAGAAERHLPVGVARYRPRNHPSTGRHVLAAARRRTGPGIDSTARLWESRRV
jgi:hypothetical protein